MNKKSKITFSLLLVLFLLPSCNGISVENQVSTAIARTQDVETVIARGIQETFEALPTNTSTATETPTITNTPTETPTQTLVPSSTFTLGPALPPLTAFYASSCSSETALMFTLVNNSNYIFRNWTLIVRDENNNSRTRSQEDFSTQPCNTAGDLLPLKPGNSSTVFVLWMPSPAGHTMTFTLTACTRDSYCYTTGGSFRP